jgi:hypothetical protein
MKKKPTAPEKKELAYKKDHPARSARGMRRSWAKRKARVNRDLPPGTRIKEVTIE